MEKYMHTLKMEKKEEDEEAAHKKLIKCEMLNVERHR